MNLSPVNEWTVYDHRKENFKLVRAETQKEAIKTAASKYGYLPQSTDDARPRTGDANLMTDEEFEEFMDG